MRLLPGSDHAELRYRLLDAALAGLFVLILAYSLGWLVREPGSRDFLAVRWQSRPTPYDVVILATVCQLLAFSAGLSSRMLLGQAHLWRPRGAPQNYGRCYVSAGREAPTRLFAVVLLFAAPILALAFAFTPVLELPLEALVGIAALRVFCERRFHTLDPLSGHLITHITLLGLHWSRESSAPAAFVTIARGAGYAVLVVTAAGRRHKVSGRGREAELAGAALRLPLYLPSNGWPEGVPFRIPDVEPVALPTHPVEVERPSPFPPF